MVKSWLAGFTTFLVASFLSACTTFSAAPDITIRSDYYAHELELEQLKDALIGDKNLEFVVHQKRTDTTNDTDPKNFYRPLMAKLHIDSISKRPMKKLEFAVSSSHKLAGGMCQTKYLRYDVDAFKKVSRFADSTTAIGHQSAINDDWGIISETINTADCDRCRQR